MNDMNRLKIWNGVIPYNCPEKRKTDIMLLDNTTKAQAAADWEADVFGTYVTENASKMDTFTWIEEIRSGKVSEYLDDTPVLTPFLADGADTAVIIAPGMGCVRIVLAQWDFQQEAMWPALLPYC